MLEEARERGFLGPEPVEHHITHGEALARLVHPPGSPFLDLGTGAGVPGLVLALCWPDSTAALLDAQRRRCAFTTRAMLRLGLGDRVRVLCGRAEDLARDPVWRGRFDLVVARAFGPPAVTAECAVGFLRRGGRLVVSEPPGEAPERWPTNRLRELGLSAAVLVRDGPTGAAIMTALGDPDERWPRRVGRPAKAPLW
jgi:16S rRNA (guanine527-N7)-methyltransferase